MTILRMIFEVVIATALDLLLLLLVLLARLFPHQFAPLYAGMGKYSRLKYVMTGPKTLMVVILHVMVALLAGAVLVELKVLPQLASVYAGTEFEIFKNLVMTDQMMGKDVMTIVRDLILPSNAQEEPQFFKILAPLFLGMDWYFLLRAVMMSYSMDVIQHVMALI